MKKVVNEWKRDGQNGIPDRHWPDRVDRATGCARCTVPVGADAIPLWISDVWNSSRWRAHSVSTLNWSWFRTTRTNGSIRLLNSIQFNSIQFNSIQFNDINSINLIGNWVNYPVLWLAQLTEAKPGCWMSEAPSADPSVNLKSSQNHINYIKFHYSIVFLHTKKKSFQTKK